MKKCSQGRAEVGRRNESDEEDGIFLRISKKNLLLLYSNTPKTTEHVIDCDILT